MTSFAGITAFVTGASRGIGKAIAIELAKEGANIVVAAKTDRPHPKLPGTIHSAVAEIEAFGGSALPVVVDVRSEEQVVAAIDRAQQHFGGIDILVNNASALGLTGTATTTMARFDLMHQVNVRATFMCSKHCLPKLERATNPHILNLAPPLDLDPRWFRDHLAYTMSKYGMSMCVLGMAAEFRERGVAVNALWPRTAIATAAIQLLGGDDLMPHCRTPQIVADAALAVLRRPSTECTGNFFIDEDVLRAEGVDDFSRYAVTPGLDLAPDLFVRPS